LKQALINNFIKTCSEKLPASHKPIRISAKIKGTKSMGNSGSKVILQKNDIAFIMTQPESKTSLLPPFLDCIIGMPVMVTKNICKRNGIINGTIGTLLDIIFYPNTPFKTIKDQTTGLRLISLGQQPQMILLKLKTNLKFPFENLPPDVFPIFTHKEYGIKLKNSDTYLDFMMEQFPLVCAIASSVYKIQGDSLESFIVANWRSKTRADQKQQGYVIVSRALTRSSFVALEPLLEDDIKYFVPSEHFLDEDARLMSKSCECTQNFFQRFANN
jgi:hypothetical protein